MRSSAPLRPAILVGVAASVVLALTACASGANDAGAEGPADSAQIAESARSLGIAPELVYTTDVDGYELAVQSVGPNGADGLQGTWLDTASGRMLTIRTDRGELTAQTCAAIPLEGAFDAAVTCEEDEDGLWHRSASDVHEYVATRDGVLIRVSGSGAPPGDLRAAAEAAHVPSAAELALLFADAPEVPTGPPVERGDIPENGDGAPIDPSGPGG
ncbi:hypothetical protein ACFC1I_10460 [Microbacterium sp. NPDC056044]|uniref:hypothetical protein n=1 Tax=Microbacterium sp. NPDC056044 TaxID=3345690 RepID=UPI0035E038E2